MSNQELWVPIGAYISLGIFSDGLIVEHSFVDLKSTLDEHRSGDLAVDNPLRHKNLIDLVLESLMQAKSTSNQSPDLDQKNSFFQSTQQQMTNINWNSFASDLHRFHHAHEELEGIDGTIRRSTRFVSLHDQIAVEKNTATIRYHLHLVGYYLHIRFFLANDQQSNEEAVSYLKRSISFTEEADGDNLAERLADLAAILGTRFEHTKQLSDIEESVSLLRRSISLTPPNNPRGQASRPLLLNRLGELLWHRFEVTGSTKDAEDAIQTHVTASSLFQQ